MGTLPIYLQHAFAEACPQSWSVTAEVALLADDLAELLGYRPQADLLLTHTSGQRIWVEFEVSRADPVANHAKFATAHLFQPQPPYDIFLSMVSPHVSRGRRNLSAATVTLLRRIGMTAFQTTLLPHLSPSEVKHLNDTPLQQLLTEAFPVTDELDRVFAVTEPVVTDDIGRIHFAGDILEVFLGVTVTCGSFMGDWKSGGVERQGGFGDNWRYHPTNYDQENCDGTQHRGNCTPAAP